MAAEIVKTSQFCCRHKLKEKLPSPPLCFGQTTANHPPTPQCGFTLIGDQKQTIIHAYTGAGKIANEGMLHCKIVKSYLTRPQTLTAVKVSKQQPPQPCAFDTQLRVRTVPGLLGKAGLDGKPPQFWEATMAWTRATPVLKRKRQQLPFSEFA